MSVRDHICILKPRDETYTAPLDIVQKVLSESKLSKSELQKPAGKGPNSGIPRIEIFAKKITNNSSDGETDYEFNFEPPAGQEINFKD